MNEVLALLCAHDCNMYGCWYPLPSTLISKHCEISRYKALKELHKLRDEGLVVSNIHCEYSDWDCRYHLFRGWNVTSAAKRTEEYKQAWEKERQGIKECYGYDVGELKIDAEL
jgi:hypothetical protein